MYLSAIAIDFGSSNSGAARIDKIKDGKLVYSTPEFCHSDGHYAKVPTWYWISPELLQRAITNYTALKDQDFRILSRNFQATANPNIVWGTDFFTQDGPGNIKRLASQGWVEFKYFKMMIYLDVSYKFDGKEYPIELVVKMFLRILKIECLAREERAHGRKVDASEVQWGITIPSIWTSKNKQLMTRVCTEVFGSHIRILSEPEGPVISERIHAGSGSLRLKKGTKSLVIDIGGGTTDICLLEDTDGCEDTKFRQLASTDGLGIGGNIIDKDFRHYLVDFFSRGLTDDSGVSYDSMDEAQRFATLYTEFTKDPVNSLIMEKAWLLFKHGVTIEYGVPTQYVQWLRKNGHNKVATKIAEFKAGDISFDPDEFHQHVYKPTFDKIFGCVETFVNNNLNHLRPTGAAVNIVFAGGLSLMLSLRDGVVSVVNRCVGRPLPYNMSNTPLLASGSIMDGASYILLYRKAVSRNAPFYIYDPGGNQTLRSLQYKYAQFGVKVELDELNEISKADILQRKVPIDQADALAIPVAVKGKPFREYVAYYFPKDSNSTAIPIEFYGSNILIVHPLGNTSCQQLVSTRMSYNRGDIYACTIDFNDASISGNARFYVKNKGTGEVKEGNIVLNIPDGDGN